MTILVDTPDTAAVPKETLRSAAALFGFASAIEVAVFDEPMANVPAVDPDYLFDPETTLTILAGFMHNRRVMITGLHGTGKSTHIEQVAARLNWPCIRVNLDSHISRMDLVGRDAIVLRDGQQVTEFREGIVPFALQRPCALVFDEYDAGRPDVMFVIQRILEAEGRLTLVEENRVLDPHPRFRLFATANTVGLGDATGLYHGTQQINQGQLDRWNIITTLDYLPHAAEVDIVLRKAPHLAGAEGRDLVDAVVRLAGLSRKAFANGDLGVLMSTRTIIALVENARILGSLDFAFRVTVLNRSDDSEHALVKEFFQRCFGRDLVEKLDVPVMA